MKKLYLSRCVAAAAACLGSSLLMLQLASCGGDDTTKSESSDASDAATTDTTMPEDGGMPTPDAPAGQDADSAAPSDANSDTGSNPEAGGAEGGDGGGGDGGFHCSLTVPAAGDFFLAYATAVCQSLKTCCATGAKFDMSTCVSIYGAPGSGSFLGAGLPARYLDGGRVKYDSVSACGCLEAINTINCALVPDQALSSIRQTCIAAIGGTVPVASADGGDASTACASSYECAPGAYCTASLSADPAPDAGGLGSCLPLAKDGGACGTDFQCSYLANGSPSLYCGGGSTCVARLDAGTTCTANSQCASNICQSPPAGGAASCASGEIFASPDLCNALFLPDGG